MSLHDKRWWKCGWSQILCRHDMHTWALKPSHTIKACVLSNHIKFWHIQAQVEGFQHWPHSLVNMWRRWIMALVMGFLIRRRSVTFQESFDKDSVDGNGKRWQCDCMMNVDENVDDLKHYAGTTCIFEPWNPPTLWRHVSYLTMSNFDAYRHNLKGLKD
jgi:hypothetical protein